MSYPKSAPRPLHAPTPPTRFRPDGTATKLLNFSQASPFVRIPLIAPVLLRSSLSVRTPRAGAHDSALDSESETLAWGEGEVEEGIEEEHREEKGEWSEAIKKVVPAVVVLRVTACRSFDTAVPSCGSATGFVVDKRRGIILTNRHVVRPGPVVAQAIFVNNEEVPVQPIYIDPVHDFGFFRYDPHAIQFLDYEEIRLAPEAVCVGLEIRVVGNDSSQKVSISAGTISRLDRNAPSYRSDYKDFNIFYIQAAVGAKKGASGSPVIDRQGRAVALNAGGTLSSLTVFFLPLDQVGRALTSLQKAIDTQAKHWKENMIPRGTIQVTFYHKGFDEARQMGLRSETEKMIRHASAISETGMLVVDSVVPGGPADSKLEPGDILVSANGEVTTHFLKLERLLDGNVDKLIEVQIERGGTSMNVNIKVQNLYSITPDHFLEVGGAVIHPLSYHQAKNFRLQCGLIYVADPGYMLNKASVPRHAILKKISGVQVLSLGDLISVLSKLPKGVRVPLEYRSSKYPHSKKFALVMIDQHEWFGAPKVYRRDDDSGLWRSTPAFQQQSNQMLSTDDPRDQSSQVDGESAFVECMHEANGKKFTGNFDNKLGGACMPKFNQELAMEERKQRVVSGEVTPATTKSSFVESLVEPALVNLKVNVPKSCMIDGLRSEYESGTGVVIHHSPEFGLIAVDRGTVATSACDVMLSFAAYPMEIPGEVVFLHPVSNFALVAYDASALGTVGSSYVKAAVLLPEPALSSGDHVYLIGLSRSLRAVSRISAVTNPCRPLSTNPEATPCFRAINMEVIELDSDFGSKFNGVLCNGDGTVQALWGCFSFKVKSGDRSLYVKGIPIYTISQTLDKILTSTSKGASLLVSGIRKHMPLVRILEVEFRAMLLSEARSFGLHDHWVQALFKKDPMRRQVLSVKHCFAGSEAEGLLEGGDMLLAINHEPVTSFREIEDACLALENNGSKNQKFSLTLFREGHEIELQVGTNVRDGNGTTRLLHWSGSILHDSHLAVRASGFLPKEGHGVYVSSTSPGTPARRYGLHSSRWIVEVNGKQTPTLDDFIDVTKDLGHEEVVRLRTINLLRTPKVLTLKQDLHYWPTWELRLDSNTGRWCRKTF